ncbi:MAG: inorganic phosphate transporter [Anaerolineales bacterium]|nr:inorganic phosphate transporter [Anaerolineales bacterium]NUQ84944.1 inorganic phosphate transporter [Anaerolineales bacterium]
MPFPNDLLLVIAFALVFEFINGMRDTSSIVATVISSRAFHPQTALGMTAAAEFVGPFLFGVTVAKTVGSDIVNSQLLTLNALVACLSAAIVWNLITWFFGIPGSSSHALIGGLLGVAIFVAGVNAINLQGLYKVLLGLFLLPPAGFLVGFVMLRIIYALASAASPRINEFFKRAQFFTAVGLALSHGANDAQKTMGMITLSLMIGGVLTEFTVPFWVIAVSAGTMALGAALGGWRLIRTLGGKFYKIRPVHSFATQMTSAVVIFGASFGGAPVSTTQVVSSAIVGVGSSERLSKVRWKVVSDILTAWMITIPISGLMAAGIYWVIVRLP